MEPVYVTIFLIFSAENKSDQKTGEHEKNIDALVTIQEKNP